MVNDVIAYPDFPTMKCAVCEGEFTVPRSWANLPVLGRQIIINWDAVDAFVADHHKRHDEELISGLENMLREDAQRRGV